MKLKTILFIKLVLIFSCTSGDKKGTAEETTTETLPKTSPDSLFAKYQLDRITLPAGFKISVFAEVPNARSMCWGANGTLFVGNRDQDKVYAVKDTDNDGVADQRFIISEKLNKPNGVAFRDGSLYVAEISRILRFDDIENKLSNPPAYTVVYDKFPDKEHHGWKFIAFGPDDKLYVPVGAPCNICDEKDSIYASITRMNPDGSGLEIFAKGVRNSVGFAWHPDTKEMWFTDNGRDYMGDDMPNCELNHAPHKGMHFGFPYCHQGDVLDSAFGKGKNCADYTPPAEKMGPHVAPLGMRFYTGNMFPAEYSNQIFIAQRGSWNRSQFMGYRVMTAKLDGAGKVVAYIPFATGWLGDDNKVTGRPVDVEIAADGALLVSDDSRGAIYRIIYSK
jgi:glucose/arabinose dehydrogenase